MVDPMTAMVIAQAAGGIIQKGASAIQRRRAKKNFQPYQIPASARASLEKAQTLATQRGIPGETIYRNKAQGSVASGVEAAERTAEAPSDVLAVLGRLYGKDYMDFEQNMAAKGEQTFERRQGQLMDSLNRFSRLETERWQYNELYPYMQAMGEAGQMDEAGNQNIGSAIGAGMSIYGMNQDMDFQREMMSEWKEGMLGPNMGAPYGRTRKSEYGVRNLPVPDINGGLDTGYRTPLNPWMNPNR